METPKKILMFQEIELLNPEPEKKKKKSILKKITYIWGNRNF